jgi:peptide methionine sulfoxide reductase msrA/msrB
MMTLRVPRKISQSGYDITPIPAGMNSALGADLEPIVRSVACEAGTERAFTGSFWDTKEEGTYVCVVCGLPLFSSKSKFDSGCGWPSYYEPIDPEHTVHITDDSHGMIRTEVRCARSGTHLGHVFDDGPPPTGNRFCINSASLTFVPQGKAIPSLRNPLPSEAASEPGFATFGAGCFWGVESTFRKVPGVTDAQVGYCGGTVTNSTYEQVCGGKTGHAEAIEVKFDPQKVGYVELLDVFFSCHDPTQLNRQGPDVGSQYRSVIFYHNDAQLYATLSTIDRIHLSGRLPRPIATEVTETEPFYRAEEYHQRYFEKSGGAGSCGIPGFI